MIRLIDVYETFEASGHAVNPQYIKFLYDLLAERPPEAHISHREMPSFEQHTAFVLGKPYRAWFLIEAMWQTLAPALVGALNVTQWNEIGIFIKRDFWRRGFAAQAIAQLQLQLQPLPTVHSVREGRWLANVAPENEASHALFKALGAKAVSITYAL